MEKVVLDGRPPEALQDDALVQRAAQCLGLSEGDRLHPTFTGQGAIFHVLFAHFLDWMMGRGCTHVVSSTAEPRETLRMIERLELLGCEATLLSPDERGQITAQSLDAAIRPDTGLVSLSWAQAFTGVMHPVLDLSQVCRKQRTPLHLEVSDAMGKVFFTFRELGADFITFSQGGGGIVAKQDFAPLVIGPPHSAEFCRALDEAVDGCEHFCTQAARLRDRLERGVLAVCPWARILFCDVERLPASSAIIFEGIKNRSLWLALQRQGVAAAVDGVSEQLEACGVPTQQALCALSFSLSRQTTESQIDFAIDRIALTANRLRAFCEV